MKRLESSGVLGAGPAVAAEDTRLEPDGGGDQRIVMCLEIERERRHARAAHGERGDGLEHGRTFLRPHQAEARATPADRPSQSSARWHRSRDRRSRAASPPVFSRFGGVDLTPAPRENAQRGIPTHGLRSLRAAVPRGACPRSGPAGPRSRRSPPRWPDPSIAGLDADVSEPTASEYLR